MLKTLLSKYHSKYELVPGFETINFEQTIKNILKDEENVINIINETYPDAKITDITSEESRKLLNVNSLVIETFNENYILFLDNMDKIIAMKDRSIFAVLSDDLKKEKVIKYFKLIEKDEDFLVKFIKTLKNIKFNTDSSFDFCIEKYTKTIEIFFKSENKNLFLDFIFSKEYSYNHSILLLKYCVEKNLIDVNFKHNDKNIITMLARTEFDEYFLNDLIKKGIKINLDKKIKDNTLRDYCLKNSATKLLLYLYINVIPKNKVEKECSYAINYVNDHEIEMIFTFLQNKDDLNEFKEKCHMIILENTVNKERKKIKEKMTINKKLEKNKKRL